MKFLTGFIIFVVISYVIELMLGHNQNFLPINIDFTTADKGFYFHFQMDFLPVIIAIILMNIPYKKWYQFLKEKRDLKKPKE